jgi:hypothetical protein
MGASPLKWWWLRSVFLPRNGPFSHEMLLFLPRNCPFSHEMLPFLPRNAPFSPTKWWWLRLSHEMPTWQGLQARFKLIYIHSLHPYINYIHTMDFLCSTFLLQELSSVLTVHSAVYSVMYLLCTQLCTYCAVYSDMYLMCTQL